MHFAWFLCYMVGATGLEPAASWSQTKHSTKLSYAPLLTNSVQQIPEPCTRNGYSILLSLLRLRHQTAL